MARRHGRKGRLYVGITDDTSAPEPITGAAKWSLESKTDKEECSAMGDTNKQYVAGLPDASGDFEGFWDDAASQLYTASRDGLARKFYLYPSTDISTKYWFGTAFFDISYEGGVEDAITFQGEWMAAGTISSNGI